MMKEIKPKYDFKEVEEGKYDLIFIPFNSIHHLYENQDLFDTLNVVKKHLKEDGLFLFDCFNPNIHYIIEAEKGLNQIAEYATADERKVHCMNDGRSGKKFVLKKVFVVHYTMFGR